MADTAQAFDTLSHDEKTVRLAALPVADQRALVDAWSLLVVARVCGNATSDSVRSARAAYVVDAPDRVLSRREAQTCVGIGRVLSPRTIHALEEEAYPI